MSNELDLTILKTLITNKKYALDFVNECDPKLFSSEMWNFANLVVSYIRTYKELPTLRVMEEKLTRGNNDALVAHVRKTWAQLDKINARDAEYSFELENLKKRYAEKQVASLRENLVKHEAGTMDITKAIGEMQKAMQSIKSINEVKAYERKSAKAAVNSFKEKFNAKRANPKLDAGLMTGYSFFDEATNGIRAADFILIAGESGFGKSLLLQNMAVQIWMQKNTIDMCSNFTEGKNIVYFSLEMPYDDCFTRLLSRLSGVPSRKIDTPHLIDAEELKKIKQALNFIKEYPYEFEIIDIVDASANDIDLILNDITFSIDALFIDYIGIMKPNEAGEEADWQKQSTIAYQTRAIARHRSLSIFSAIQLNRKGQGKDSSETIGLHRLARSAGIATHATHILQIENRAQEEGYPDLMIHWIKNRKGPKIKGRLIKNLACATLVNDVKKDEEPNVDFYNYKSRDVEDISGQTDLLDI